MCSYWLGMSILIKLHVIKYPKSTHYNKILSIQNQLKNIVKLTFEKLSFWTKIFLAVFFFMEE